MAAISKASQEACNGDGIAFAAGTAAASILGNIAQALDRSKLKGEKATLLRERKRLTSVLEQWQLAYNQLRMSFETHQEELKRTSAYAAKLEADVRSLTRRNLALEEKLADLRAEVQDAQ